MYNARKITLKYRNVFILFSHRKWPVIHIFFSPCWHFEALTFNHKTATLSPLTSQLCKLPAVQYANELTCYMQTMLCFLSRVSLNSFKVFHMKLLRLCLVLLWWCCVGVCLNHQLLLLPSFPPSTSTLPFNTPAPDYRPLHYSCNLSFSDKPVFNPFQVDKTNCVPNCKLCSIWWGGELNAARVQLSIIVGLCVSECVVWFLCPLAPTATVNSHW